MNYTDLPKIALEQVQHFFEHYKDLEPGKWVKMNGWGDAAEAKRLIREAIERAKGMMSGIGAQRPAGTLQGWPGATKRRLT